MNTDKEAFEGEIYREEQIKKKKFIIKMILKFQNDMEARYYTDEFFHGIRFACREIIKIIEKEL
jgi:hypothetical protein